MKRNKMISEYSKWLIYKYLMIEACQNTIPYIETWYYWIGYGKLNQN